MVTMKLFDFIRTSMFQLRYFALTILLDSVIGDPVHSEIAFDLRDCSDRYNKLTLIYKQNVIVLFIFTFATHVTDSGLKYDVPYKIFDIGRTFWCQS